MGETGNTDKDTAYAGDYLGVAQKLSGSSVVFKGSDGIVRNSVSIGDMSYAANPDFDYATGGNSGTGGTGGDTRTIWEKGIDSLLKVVSIFTGTGSSPTANTGGESDGQNNNNNGNNGNNNNNNNGDGQDKTFIQKYGIYGLILAIIGVVIALIVKKPKPVQPQNTYQAPQFPQQYQSVKF